MADELDDLIAKRRKALGKTPVMAPKDDVSTLIAARRKALNTPEPGMGERIMSSVGHALEQLVTHPIETAKGMGKAALTDLATIGENMNAGMGQPNQNTPEIADQLPGALARTGAAAAFPGIESAVAGRLGGSFAARGAGLAAAGAVNGAVNNPHDPIVAAATGGILAPAVGVGGRAAVRAVGAAGGRGITALGLRPTGRAAAELVADAEAMRRPVGPEASATPVTSSIRPSEAPHTPVIRGPKARAAFGKAVESAGVESAKTVALREYARRLNLDNVSPADAIAYVEQNPSKPLAALNVGGGNVAGLARLAKDTPSLARRDIPEFLHGQTSGTDGATLQRVTQDFENRIGLAPEDYYAAIEDMTAKQKATAKVDYDKVRNLVVDDPEVLSLFDEPEFAAIHDRIRANRRLGGQGKIDPLSTVENIGGEEVRTLNPQTLGTLDLMKRQLDKIRQGKADAIGAIDKDQAYNMGQRLESILTRMDDLYPDYGKARKNYRGSAEGIDAYEAGKTDFSTQDPRLTATKLAKMPERVQDLYRRGQYDALRVRLSKMDDGANIGAFLEKNPDIRARVAALAKTPDESTALRGDLGVERAIGDRKNQILGGPNTAERLIEHWSTVPVVTHVGNLARKVPVVGKFGGDIVDNALARRLSNQTGDVMGEVGKLMTTTGPAGMRQLMAAIEELQRADAAKAVTQRRIGGALGVGAQTQQQRR